MYHIDNLLWKMGLSVEVHERKVKASYQWCIRFISAVLNHQYNS